MNYQQIFELRGAAYDQAMLTCPDSRAEEFVQAVRRADLTPGMRVGDVPSGGGYLQRWLPEGVTWLGHDPCGEFLAHRTESTVEGTALLPLPWADGELDCVISLAGVHHLEDKQPLWREIHRCLRPGGRVVVSDVAEGSAVARFLDDYVGAHNSTGHDGHFLTEALIHELERAGFIDITASLEPVLWRFADEPTMAKFCQRLFDLGRTPWQHTLAEIHRRLGVVRVPEGVGMRWELLTFSARRG